MHTPTWWRRCGADVEAAGRGRVRVDPQHGPGEELLEVHVPSVDIAADEVGVPPFEIHRPRDALRKNTVPETGGETFYLRLDPLRHVEGRAVWDVAVRPYGMLAFGGARLVEEALLGEQDERPLGVLTARDGGLAGGDLVQCCAEVDSPGPLAALSCPGDRAVQREVHLEDTRTVAVALEGPPIPLREVLAGNGEELSGRHVEEYCAGPRHLLHVIHPDARVDLAP